MAQCDIHNLNYCALCGHNGMSLSDIDDLDTPDFPPRPVRSWGGPGTVPVWGKDDKPVQIPSASQYMWMVRGREEQDARLAAIAYSYVPRVPAKKSLPAPDSDAQQDIAQSGVLKFIEWNLDEPSDDPFDIRSFDDIKKLCFFVGVAYYDWLRTQTRRAEAYYLDELTGLKLSAVETWAEPGMYNPLMGLLVAAKQAEEPTAFQKRLLRALEIFDPEGSGSLTRTEPLDQAERQFLRRLREEISGEAEEKRPAFEASPDALRALFDRAEDYGDEEEDIAVGFLAAA